MTNKIVLDNIETEIRQSRYDRYPSIPEVHTGEAPGYSVEEIESRNQKILQTEYHQSNESVEFQSATWIVLGILLSALTLLGTLMFFLGDVK